MFFIQRQTKLLRRIWWEIVSKAAVKSRRMRMVSNPESVRVRVIEQNLR